MKFYVVYEKVSDRRLFYCHTRADAEKFIRENPSEHDLRIRVGTPDDISVEADSYTLGFLACNPHIAKEVL
jgi:hypothetical protein